MRNKTDRLPIGALLLAALLALALAGCGGGCDEDESELQRRNPTVNCALHPQLCK
jgi:hypothetical protein